MQQEYLRPTVTHKESYTYHFCGKKYYIIKDLETEFFILLKEDKNGKVIDVFANIPVTSIKNISDYCVFTLEEAKEEAKKDFVKDIEYQYERNL